MQKDTFPAKPDKKKMRTSLIHHVGRLDRTDRRLNRYGLDGQMIRSSYIFPH